MEEAVTNLSATDHREIHELVAYNFTALDNGEVEAWVHLFTQDGRLTDPAGKSWVGLDELTSFARERKNRPDIRQRRHGFNNLIITPTSDGARSSFYCMEIEQTSEGCRVYSMSAITDDLQLAQGRWRIKTRRVSSWPSA